MWIAWTVFSFTNLNWYTNKKDQLFIAYLKLPKLKWNHYIASIQLINSYRWHKYEISRVRGDSFLNWRVLKENRTLGAGFLFSVLKASFPFLCKSSPQRSTCRLVTDIRRDINMYVVLHWKVHIIHMKKIRCGPKKDVQSGTTQLLMSHYIHTCNILYWNAQEK